MANKVTGMGQIIPLNQTITAIHEKDGRKFNRAVLCLALVNYSDGGQGIELMELGARGKVKPLADTAKQIKIVGEIQEEEIILDIGPTYKPFNENPFLNGHRERRNKNE